MEFKDFVNTVSDFGGEMSMYERYKLFCWVSEYKPKIIFEVGTGVGGGSTHHMAYAIETIKNNGIIYTCDPIRSIDYKLMLRFPSIIKFHSLKSQELLNNMINEKLIPDFIFFDGPEEPEIAMNDIIELEKHIKIGTIFSMHDWDSYRQLDKATSTKSKQIRPYLENSENWKLIDILKSDVKNCDESDREYDSVGLCLYKKIK